jgi:plasmid replication initiation protein
MGKELKRVVGQSNELIRKTTYRDLDINDLKVFRTIVSKVNYNNGLFDDIYIVNYDELDLVGIERNRRFTYVTKSLKKLANTYVKILDKNGIEIELGLITNKFKYPKRSSQILVNIDDDLKPYLLELKEEYTKYGLENINKFRSKYDLKIYELMKSWEAKGSYSTTIIKFREYLEIEESKYKSYANLKQRIINKAIDNINKNTDINITLIENSPKNKVESIVFKIQTTGLNNQPIGKTIDKDFMPNIDTMKFLEEKKVVDVFAVISMFKEHYEKTQEKFVDWQPAFKRYVLRGINEFNSIEIKR